MFGISELLQLDKLEKQKEQVTKFSVLRSRDIDKKVFKFLEARLSNLSIEVLDIAKGNILTLMNLEKLEGWCWETTESAIVFFDDSDDINRGILNISEKYPKYYHSWICFSYESEEYVFDPCLNLVCKKQDYMNIFNIQIKGKVNAKDVKSEFIRQIINPKREYTSKLSDDFLSLMKGFMEEGYIERKKEEVIVHGVEDVNAPLYRNGAGYKIEVENDKIKKMCVHYYY